MQFNREIVIKMLKIIPLWKLVLCLGTLFSTSGVLKFWGINFNWIYFIYVVLFSFLTIILARWLQIRFAFYRERVPLGKNFSILTSAWRKKVEFNPDDAVPVFNFIMFLTCIVLMIFYLWMAHLIENRFTINIFLLFLIMTVLIYAYAGSYRKISWLEEIADGIITVFTPSIWISAQYAFEASQLSILSFVLPILCFFLSFRFVFSMIIVEENIHFSPGLFVAAIHNKNLRIHHIFPFAAYSIIILTNIMGVHWRIQWPQFFTIPTIVIQIILIERILAGKKFEKNILFFLSFANILLLEYLQTAAIWLNQSIV